MEPPPVFCSGLSLRFVSTLPRFVTMPVMVSANPASAPAKASSTGELSGRSFRTAGLPPFAGLAGTADVAAFSVAGFGAVLGAGFDPADFAADFAAGFAAGFAGCRSCAFRLESRLGCLEVMFDGCLDGKSGAAGRNGLQKEAVHLPAIDQVHQHFAVVAPARDDVDQACRLATQMLGQLLDVFADHRRIHYGHADLATGNCLFGLSQRICVVDLVHAPHRLANRSEKILVLGQHEHIDLAGVGRDCGRDFLRIEHRLRAGAFGDDRCPVLGGLHDDVFAGWFVRARGHVVRGFRQGEQAHLPSGIVHQSREFLGFHAAADDLEYFLVADHRFEVIVRVVGEQNADGFRRALARFAQCFDAAHPRQVASGNDHVDGRVAERIERLRAGGRTVNRITIVEPRTQAVEGALFAVQQQYLGSDSVPDHVGLSARLC